ncbi:Bcr/CflA family efflux MFS transporter [Seohaeicola zhoushanensis]
MLRTGLVLGLLALVGPFAIDMYLPAMPGIAAAFGTPETAVQATLTGYFIAFGVAQLVYGPLADRYGRRLPVFLGLAVFVAGSIGAATAGSIGALVTWRAVQGLGGAALMVVPRAIVRDMYTGPQATRLMAMIMLVISVSPMLAPLAGSAVIAVADWRTIFAVLAVAGLLSLLVTALVQPETLPPERRLPINAAALIRGGRDLLRDPGFMGLTLIGDSAWRASSSSSPSPPSSMSASSASPRPGFPSPSRSMPSASSRPRNAQATSASGWGCDSWCAAAPPASHCSPSCSSRWRWPG